MTQLEKTKGRGEERRGKGEKKRKWRTVNWKVTSSQKRRGETFSSIYCVEVEVTKDIPNVLQNIDRQNIGPRQEVCIWGKYLIISNMEVKVKCVRENELS